MSPDLFPYFQPFVYLPNGRIAGYEMLARRRDADGRVVSAGALFGDPSIPVGERIALDRLVRLRGFETFVREPDAGFLSVNISPDWIDRLESDASPTMRMIEATGIDPSRVVIEITETAGDAARLRRIVDRYHAFGLRVAIDDFGAGNSQIDRIVALEPDLIKLDMQLFKAASLGGLSADVLLGMMSMAERAGCEIVCEGVETIDEFMFGIECGAKYMQGYLFAPALAEPIDPMHFNPHVRVLLKEYFDRKRTRLEGSIDHSRAVKDVVLRLRAQLAERIVPAELPDDALRELGIMRFFVCDTEGAQVSPNYEITESGVALDDRCIGFNWSWRPYFPTLAAMKRRADAELVASNIYRDASTTKLCKTFGLFLDASRVLFVDVQVRDDVLYAANSARDAAGGTPAVAPWSVPQHMRDVASARAQAVVHTRQGQNGG